MRTLEIKVYQYSELNEKAQEKARQWWIDGMDFNFEWDCIVEDAKNIGLELKEWDYLRYATGHFEISAKDCANKILKEHGETCQTFKTAFKFMQEIFAADKRAEETGSEEEIEDLEKDFLLSLLEDYRIMTDNQLEYVQSKEAVEEMLIINEYEFTEEGKIYA